MHYLDVLDPVKSGYPDPVDWWHPATYQHQHAALAETEGVLLIRALYGESLTLSQTQAFDSVAWLGMIEKVIKLCRI